MASIDRGNEWKKCHPNKKKYILRKVDLRKHRDISFINNYLFENKLN